MDVGFSGVPLFLTLQCAVDANVIVVIRLKGHKSRIGPNPRMPSGWHDYHSQEAAPLKEKVIIIADESRDAGSLG